VGPAVYAVLLFIAKDERGSVTVETTPSTSNECDDPDDGHRGSRKTVFLDSLERSLGIYGDSEEEGQREEEIDRYDRSDARFFRIPQGGTSERAMMISAESKQVSDLFGSMTSASEISHPILLCRHF